MDEEQRKTCLKCSGEYVYGMQSCPSCGAAAFMVTAEAGRDRSIDATVDHGDIQRQTRAAVARDSWDPVVSGVLFVNLVGVAVVVPAFALAAAVPLPFAMLAGLVSIPVGAVNIIGVLVSLLSAIFTRRYRRSCKLLGVSVIPAVLEPICILIARQQ